LLRVASLIDFFQQGYVYTASFAEDDDLLSQWRGYGAGGGVCLGFVVSDLQRVAERAGFRLVKCIYEQSQKTPLDDERVEEFATRLSLVTSS